MCNMVSHFHYSDVAMVVDSQRVAEAALMGKRVVKECEEEMRPDHASSSCLDENVCLRSMQKYFYADAWSVVSNVMDTIRTSPVSNVMDTIRTSPVWYCGRCTKSTCDETEFYSA